MNRHRSRSAKNLIQYIGIRIAASTLRLFPLAYRRIILRNILSSLANRLQKHRNIAHRNISLVYPELEEVDRQALFQNSFASMGDLFIDFIRFPKLTETWAKSQIEFPNLSQLKRTKERNPSKGILFVTGHLGSFELSASCLPLLYRPISFIVRDFSNPFLNSWWKKTREVNGNTVISRVGGYRKMVQLLRRGRDVGVLFDQNVTRNHALFVNWFGRSAATTKALALAALRTEAPIFVVAIIQKGNDDYIYECIECDCADIYRSTYFNKEQKLTEITERLVCQFEQLIRKYPESWFWIHRKWKTAPVGCPEDFYDGC